MKIGDTIWLFSINRIVYPKPKPGEKYSSGGPIYREHWMPVKITGETSRSWILGEGRGATKAPKKGDHRGFAFSQQEVDDDCYVHKHKPAIVRCVDLLRDAATLKRIADLVGYVPERKPK